MYTVFGLLDGLIGLRVFILFWVSLNTTLGDRLFAVPNVRPELYELESKCWYDLNWSTDCKQKPRNRLKPSIEIIEDLTPRLGLNSRWSWNLDPDKSPEFARKPQSQHQDVDPCFKTFLGV